MSFNTVRAIIILLLDAIVPELLTAFLILSIYTMTVMCAIIFLLPIGCHKSSVSMTLRMIPLDPVILYL
jgi:hypothetical protein